MASVNEPCSGCGSLGPHAFLGESAAPSEPADGSRRKEGPAHGYAGRPQSAIRPEQHSPPPADDVPAEAKRPAGRPHDDDDSRFPAGMRSRSPILDHIRDLDNVQGEPKKRTGKSRPAEYEERAEHRSSYSYSDDKSTEQEQPQPDSNGGIGTTIISVVLVIVLVIAAIYIINNFDEITKWLASPTVPEVFKPLEE